MGEGWGSPMVLARSNERWQEGGIRGQRVFM